MSSAVCNECRSIPPPRQNTDIYKPQREFLYRHQIPQHNNLGTYNIFQQHTRTNTVQLLLENSLLCNEYRFMKPRHESGGYSLVSYLERPRSIPGHSMWELLWTQCQWRRIYSEYFGFPLSLSLLKLCTLIRSRPPKLYELRN